MTQARVRRSFSRLLAVMSASVLLALLFSGCSGSTYIGQTATPIVTIQANPSSMPDGQSSTLTVSATYAATVVVTGTDGSTYTLATTGGTQSVTPSTTTTYTATATGPGGTTTATATVTVTSNPPPTVSITTYPANQTSVNLGGSVTLYVTATNATGVQLTSSDGTPYPAMAATGGSQVVRPAMTPAVTYTATAAPEPGQAPALAAITINVGPAGTIQNIQHIIFMMQENHTFDNYFGMLNPYRKATNDTLPDGTKRAWNIGDDGKPYNVDGIDDRLTPASGPANPNALSNVSDEGTTVPLFPLTTTCIDDDSSDWLASFGDVNRYYSAGDRNTSTDPNRILMDGYVHNAEGYANSCNKAGAACTSGVYGQDPQGQRAMGYYDQNTLNYYYYMASQFSVSDRWFSPVASKSVDNRIATLSGGTTLGLVKDPSSDDHLTNFQYPDGMTIFYELDHAVVNNVPSPVSWKLYYTSTVGLCLADNDECHAGAPNPYPATFFSNFGDSYQYLHTPVNGSCGNLQRSSVPPINDSTNSFCIDPTHIAPLSQFEVDLASGELAQFVFIEPGYGNDDEHPGSGQPVTNGQAGVASILSNFMASQYWSNSVFFLAYDEGGGPYDHVPPVPGHSNDQTITDVGYLGAYPNGQIPDIAGISVNPDVYIPDTLANCPYKPPAYPNDVPAQHCDVTGPPNPEPGGVLGDIVNTDGFAAQLGFRVPNMIISPFAKRHFVSHLPIDHTAIIKFVEDRFIGPDAHLTSRDAAQPDLSSEFFDFNSIPWETPPTDTQSPPPTPQDTGNTCNAALAVP